MIDYDYGFQDHDHNNVIDGYYPANDNGDNNLDDYENLKILGIIALAPIQLYNQ